MTLKLKLKFFTRKSYKKKGINLSLVESWEKGGEGAKDLAQKIVDLVQEPSDFKFAYELNETIENKIKDRAQKNIWGRGCRIHRRSKIAY